ncbi:MAG: PEP-CTERM sorting domain-containing protein [Phycisphaeraceae bacterium]
MTAFALGFVLLTGAPSAQAAATGPPVNSSPFGTDLDGDGSVEVAGSRMSRRFEAEHAPGGHTGTISFSYMFLTSEHTAAGNADAFRIRLTDDSGNVLRQSDGAVAKGSYNGNFTPYDFSNPDLAGPAILPATGSKPLYYETVLNDGGIGWGTFTHTYTAGITGFLSLEFVIGSAADQDYPSALLIADVKHTATFDQNLGWTSDFTHPNTGEASANGWSTTGNWGIYSDLYDAAGDGLGVAFPGRNFMALSTAAEASATTPTSPTTPIPEPGTGVLLLGLAGLAGAMKRRAHRHV